MLLPADYGPDAPEFDVMSPHRLQLDVSPYITFSRKAWAELRADTPLSLDEEDLDRLRGINTRLNMDEVVDIYLPLSRLLNLYVSAAQHLHSATSRFLHTQPGTKNGAPKTPYIIGLAGSVAVGKSTTARVLQALLARWPNHPRVDMLTTDGFLLPNAVLEERGLMERKGFPESFDTARLLQFLADVKAGKPDVKAPVYSHNIYDIVEGQLTIVDRPDVLIVEGLNVLQPAVLPRDGEAIPFVSDYFDFSVYIDADVDTIGRWYLERFMRLRDTAFRKPGAYFARFAQMPEDEALAHAREIWRKINRVNLMENILPTRRRADLILTKGADHLVQTVQLRRL